MRSRSPEGMNVEGDIKLKAIETPAERKHRHQMEVREFWVEEAPIHLTAIGIVVCGVGTQPHLLLQAGLFGRGARNGRSRC